MAFALVGFLFVMDYSLNGGKWSWSNESTTNTFVTNANNTNDTNSTVNTNTSSITNINTNINTAAPEVLPAGVQRYTSTKLSVTFTYLVDEGGTIQEIGDKIYVGGSKNNPTDGQFVQVFTKDAADTISQAVTKRFLSGISTQDCFVTILPLDDITQTQSAAIIDWPSTLIDDSNPFGDNSKCPKQYQKTNGARYFLTDNQDPTKLLFFSIGQYAINGLNDNYKTTWQQTLRLTANNSTAGWKTYTNTKYGYSLKHTAPWSIRNEVTTTESVVFGCGVATECRDEVSVSKAPASLAAWKATYSEAPHMIWKDTTVDGNVALRVDTNEFGLSYIGVIKGEWLYVIGGNSFLDKGLLSTFTFIQ